MSTIDLHKHWENLYETKDTTHVGWFQQKPTVSISFLEYLGIPKSAKILDAGGGDSLLVDYLLDMGYQKITVLDISAAAIEHAQIRLGSIADQVHWIVDDLGKCNLDQQYDVWHDRAAFHFLTKKPEQDYYLELVQKTVKSGGYLILATFSKTGPPTCSGLPVTQYSIESLTDFFSEYFQPVKCLNTDHLTPGGMKQNFSFCAFRRK